MKRRLVFVSFILIAFILGWFANDVYSFKKGMEEDKFADYQLRPTNVPKEALWAGGVDGGNWYVVKDINPNRAETTLEVSDDQDGSLIMSSLPGGLLSWAFHFNYQSESRDKWFRWRKDIIERTRGILLFEMTTPNIHLSSSFAESPL
jgi:hypothetical protein